LEICRYKVPRGGSIALDWNLYSDETVNGVRTASRTGSVSGAAGIITSDIILRLPLDEFWSGVTWRPTGSLGSVRFFGGGGGETINTQFPELNARFNSISRGVQSRPLGHVGGGFEYRFTPHIGIFAEAGYDFVDHTNGRTGSNNSSRPISA